MSSTSVPNLIHFLESVPPPVTVLLVDLAPLISRLRWAAEVVSWKTDWTDSWLVLAGWWAICLSTNAVLRYLLPLALLLPALLPYLPSWGKTRPQTPPTTEHSISLCLSDITTLQSLMPTLPTLPTLSFPAALRLSALLFIPYIGLTHFIPLSILVGVAGTLLLTYRAPWAHTLRTVLWHSAYIRRFLFRLWYLLTGIIPSALTSLTAQTTPPDSRNTQGPAPPSPPLHFLFTILECQRWWMGLDWTAALLPAERPSWCSVSQQPTPPPGAFSLPPPTSIYLPVANGNRFKRTAMWRWEDPEWGVWINKEGTGSSRMERKPPGLEDEEGSTSIATKAASMLRERKASVASRPEMSPTEGDHDLRPSTSTGSNIDISEEIVTDPDGWVYSDNKWEGAGPKGGLGKYTRYRQWTRIAVLTETVEEVGLEDVGRVQAGESKSPAGNLPQEEKRESEPGSPLTALHARKESKELEEERSNLRLRLKTATQAGPNKS